MWCLRAGIKNYTAGPRNGHIGYVAEGCWRKGNWMVRWGEWQEIWLRS